jgi:hypothetical protein
LPKVFAVAEQLARAGVVRAGGRIEKDASGAECFVIPVQQPKPSKFTPSYAPGPVTGERFTPEEMAKIKYPAEKQ